MTTTKTFFLLIFLPYGAVTALGGAGGKGGGGVETNGQPGSDGGKGGKGGMPAGGTPQPFLTMQQAVQFQDSMWFECPILKNSKTMYFTFLLGFDLNGMSYVTLNNLVIGTTPEPVTTNSVKIRFLAILASMGCNNPINITIDKELNDYKAIRVSLADVRNQIVMMVTNSAAARLFKSSLVLLGALFLPFITAAYC